MSINQRVNVLLLGVIFSSVVFSSVLSRPWKPTPVQLAGDYAAITHTKSNTDFVNIRWWAEPTVMPGTPLASLLQKYIVISVVHFHINLPGGAMSTEDVDTLEARDSSNSNMVLTPVPRNALPPTAIATLTGFEASFRQSLGRLGEGTKFFIFDAGTVRACEKGGISVPLAGETYTWETPFPGCSK
jgi:hypothetical protein